MNTYHQPVMVTEVLAHLHPKPNTRFIDCTLGGGGHTRELLSKGAEVLALDCDQEAIEYVTHTLGNPVNLHLVKSNFVHLPQVAASHSFTKVDGILFDLGVSSHQLTSGHRGFSLKSDSPLDMRMDQNLSVKASDLLAALGPNELKLLFTKFANEPRAKQIADRIATARHQTPITTTLQLARIVESIYPRQTKRIHPATKVFQALRIAINDELNSIQDTLPSAVDLLKPGGKLVVISFHQGEDVIVKDFFKSQAQQGRIQIDTAKPQTPSTTEINNNKRARSAKLRAATKL